MQGPANRTARVPICDADHLAAGGVTRDTEILTTTGPQSVTTLEPGQQVLALNPTTKVVRPKHVVDIETFDPPPGNISLETRRADLLVTPDHQVPYTTRAISRPRFVRAGDLTTRESYKFVNNWRPRSSSKCAQIDLTNYCSTYEINAEFDVHGQRVQSLLPDGCDPCRHNSHTGYFFDPTTFKEYQNELEALAESLAIHAGPNHWRRPYRFDGDDFIEFIGWFVTEGSVTWLPDSDTARIGLAQQTQEHRETIAALLDRMGLPVQRTENGFSFGSKLFGRLLERICGTNAATKRLPEFIWECSASQKQLLLETMMDGDGNDWGVYYTTSEDLAGDVLRLLLELGYKPRYSNHDTWKVYRSTSADGITTSRNVSTASVEGPMYRLAIEDFSTIMAGRHGKFQWVGVSAVV